jgi:hypothetical protein
MSRNLEVITYSQSVSQSVSEDIVNLNIHYVSIYLAHTAGNEPGM